ncbi:MAG: enoyl-CoA hydratase/isomerase family protein [Rhodothermales bacterium]|nr:enoyl-CoA hydratase/isomerase family protein [Rhodothermales bacterium]
MIEASSSPLGILNLRLNRPEKKNALTVEMYAALADALAEANTDGTRVVVLAGEGGALTAGNDLADFMARPPTGPDSPVFRFLRALADLAVPLVVAVRGPAVGVGTTLLLHADLAYAADDAVFLTPFTALGLVPEAASSLLLPQRIGPAKAAELLLLGRKMLADEAAACGLINAVVADPDAAAHAAAERLAALPADAVRQTKALLRKPLRDAVDAALEAEGAVFLDRLHADDTRAILGAWLSGRR